LTTPHHLLLALAFKTFTFSKGGQERRALAATFVGLQYTLYYWFRVVEVPVVRFQRTFWNVSVVEKAQLLRRQFRPIFWMTNRHLQTVRRRRTLKAKRQ
jgi:hypothetical protein